jgi:hypothetical protein
MGTKNNPGQFDCYGAALPDEPMFVLLARDPSFATIIREWVNRRHSDIMCGERPKSDLDLIDEAVNCANAGEAWRRNNLGKWRGSRK